METKLYNDEIFLNKLNEYFSENIRLTFKIFESFQTDIKLYIITKIDLFYEIDLKNKNVPSFIINNDYSVIDSMIVHDLYDKQIVDIIPCARFCFARNNENIIYYWDEINRIKHKG
jgi:hypothetical protein